MRELTVSSSVALRTFAVWDHPSLQTQGALILPGGTPVPLAATVSVPRCPTPVHLWSPSVSVLDVLSLCLFWILHVMESQSVDFCFQLVH